MTTGGGGTHIATTTGLLRVLGSKNNILIASGGGGGGRMNGNVAINGSDAGGMSGRDTGQGNPGTQSTGYAFGQGEYATAGGGGGIYGGCAQGGGGSGYIGNYLVGDKKMVGYEVETSSDTDTKTESVTTYSSKGERDKPKVGNGSARIIYKGLVPPSSWTRIQTILDRDQQIADYMVTGMASDKIIQKKQQSWDTGWHYVSDGYYLDRYLAANETCMISKKFIKNKATKLYIRAKYSRSGSGYYPIARLFISRNMITAWSDFGSPYGYLLNNTSVSTIAETTFEYSLDSLSYSDGFYIGWHNCDTIGQIVKIYFDDEVAIVP